MRTMLLISLFCIIGSVSSQQSADSSGMRFLNAAFTGDTVVVRHYSTDSTILNFSDANGYNALMFAAATGHFDVCKILVESGIKLENRDRNGRSALHIAIHEGQFDIAEYLAWIGVDIETGDILGRSPLHISAALNQVDITDMLIFYGADINALSRDRSTPLHYAAYYGAVNTLELLLSNNPNVDLRNEFGYTSIMLAAQNRKTECFWLLFQHDPSTSRIRQRNHKGFSTLDILTGKNEIAVLKNLPLFDMTNNNERIIDSLARAAMLRNMSEISKELITLGAKAGFKPSRPSYIIGFQQKASLKDFYTAFETGLYEHRYQLDILAGSSFRPYAKKIRIPYENMIVQVWDRRWYLYSGIRKYWDIYYLNQSKISLSTGYKYAICFYRYRGIEEKQRKGIAMYEAGLSYRTRIHTLSIGYEFKDFKISRSSPHHLVFSWSFLINTNKIYKDFQYIW